jgi:hypothetical protein
MIFGRDQPSEREEKITRNNEETQEAARWVYSGLSPHNGEYYYQCKVCKEEDWIASYGTLDQLKCKC